MSEIVEMKYKYAKSSHAAAFALVGWFLMIPPIFPNQEIVPNAPLSQWKTIDTYQTAVGCQTELAKLTALVAGNVTQNPIQKRTLAAQCVSSDDLRLNSN
ncbi:MAG: hypothetical protein ABSD30_05905 [Candidatus Binatus sp.]